MPQFFVAIHHPNDYDPFVEEDAEMMRNIDLLNEEMIAAGVRVYANGLKPPSLSKSIRVQPDGKVEVTEGPHFKFNEHIGGFWILETKDMGEAVEWGRKATVACKAPVEVRPFY